MPEKDRRFRVFRPDSQPTSQPDGGGRELSPEEAYAAARARLEEQIAREPENGQARLELGSLASFAGDLGTACTYLARAVELMPDDPRAHLRYGDVLYETARLAEAVEHYGEAARLLWRPEEAGGKVGMPLAEEARVELELAEKELDLIYRPLEQAEKEAEEEAGKGKAERGPAAAAFNRLGCLQLAAGRLDDAAETFRRAIGLDPESLQAALNFGLIQGLAMVEPSRLKRSVSELASAAERFPAEPRLYLHLAELYEASSLYAAAVARIEEALEVAPGCLEAYDMASRYVMLGGEYEEEIAGKIDRIVAAAEAARERDPGGKDTTKALALALLGRSRFRRDDGDELARARSLLGEIADDDKDDDARLRLAECRERMGETREAERLLGEIAGRAADAPAARAQVEIGALRLRTGRPAEAVDAFARAVALTPEDAVPYQSLRYALAAARKLKTAELLCRAELAHDPRSVDAHLDLGRAFLEARRIDEAVEVLGRATELAPERADVHAAFGKALMRAGRPEDAEVALRKAVELEPQSAEAHRALGDLLIELPGRMREGLAQLEEYRRLKASAGPE